MSEELENFVSEEDTTVEMTAETQTTDETPVENTESVEQTESSQGDTGEPPAPAEKTQETMIPLAAKQAEKERRKQAEQEAQNLRVELARLQGQSQAQNKPAPVEVPDPYVDPEGYTKFIVNQDRMRQRQESDAQLRARLASAEEVARVEFNDYDKYAEHFATSVAKNNPQVIEMMKASPDPAKFAYYKGKQHMQETEIQSQIQAAGGLEAYTKQIAEQARAEALAEKPATVIPPDLTSVRNTGSDPMNGEIASGTDGLNQLLGR